MMTLRALTPILRPLARWYLSGQRSFQYKEIRVMVRPQVFHPGLFFSTRILLDYLGLQDIKEARFLELGAGTGIISMLAKNKGANVTATDINPLAIENIRDNCADNDIEIEVIQSNLFEKVPSQTFDWIVINPPYYPRNPQNNRDYAWYCGENHEFFRDLFSQLEHYIHPETNCIMILSDQCDIQKIKRIGESNGFNFKEVYRRQKWGEWNFIYQVS
ncbi:MAG: methyltransferase [Bacteroidetes bacterium]|nr:methyltransferase [Bacteroidota bacterium]